MDLAPRSSDTLQPGQRLARGVARHLSALGFAPIEEFVPARGLRMDVFALGPKSELWCVECKSSRADFASDHKWDGYRAYCDRFFWAVDAAFPSEILPDETGLIFADDFDAEVIRMAPEHKLAGARRKALIHKFALCASRRLHILRDPGAMLSGT